jgi:hypothetical protein
MDKVLIAYNNDSTTILHDFLESCADEAKQICADNGIEYSSVYPPEMSKTTIYYLFLVVMYMLLG